MGRFGVRDIGGVRVMDGVRGMVWRLGEWVESHIFLVRSSSRFCHKMMVEYGGLEVLIRLVRTRGDSKTQPMAMDSLLLLASRALEHGSECCSESLPYLVLQGQSRGSSGSLWGAPVTSENRTCTDDVPRTPPCRQYYCRYIDTDHTPFDTVAIIHGDGASGTFPVHQSVLTEMSEMFAVMFSGRYQESNCGVVTIKGIRPLVFCSVLHFLYGCRWSCPEAMAAVLGQEMDDVTTSSNDMSDLERFSLLANEHYIEAITSQFSDAEGRIVMGHCLRVLACAKRFLLPGLSAECEQYLGTLLCPGVVVPLFQFSELHSSGYLSTRCIHCLLRMPHTQLKRTVFQKLLDSSDSEEAITLLQRLIVCSR